MNKKIIILFGIVCFLFFLLALIEKDRWRCSSFGSKILDDILQFEVGVLECRDHYSKGILIDPDPDHGQPIPISIDEHYLAACIKGIMPYCKFSDISKKIKLDCPINSDVIVIIGQSNSANHGSSKITVSNKDLNFFENNCYSLSEPVLGARGNNDSITSSLSSKIKNKKPIIFLTNGAGGSSIQQWSESESIFTTFVNKNLKQLIKNNNLKYIIWIQGESDRLNESIDYIKHFDNFKNQLFKEIDPIKLKNLKFIITQTSICGINETSYPHIVSQQKKLSEIYSNVIVTNVTDNLDRNYRIDGCHFNSFGIEKIADEISGIINEDYK